MAQDGCRQGIARVKTGFFQVVEDVIERWQANTYSPGDFDPGSLLAAAISAGGTVTAAAAKAILQFDELAELGYTLGRFRSFVVTGWQHREDGARSRVTFGVDEGVIKRLNAISDFEEARRLHKGSRAKPGHLLQLFT